MPSNQWIDDALELSINMQNVNQYMTNFNSQYEKEKRVNETVTTTLNRVYFSQLATYLTANPDQAVSLFRQLKLINLLYQSQLLLSIRVQLKDIIVNKRLAESNLDGKKAVKGINDEITTYYLYFGKQLENEIEMQVKNIAGLVSTLDAEHELINNLERHFKTFEAHNDSYEMAMYLLVRFGETLRENFVGLSSAEIKIKLSDYQHQFSHMNVEKYNSLRIAEAAIAKFRCEVNLSEESEAAAVLNDFILGLEVSRMLLGKTQLQTFKTEKIINSAKTYITEDIIPNSKNRKMLIAELKLFKLNHAMSNPKKVKYINNFLSDMLTIIDSYYLFIYKSPNQRDSFLKVCQQRIEDADKTLAQLSPVTSYETAKDVISKTSSTLTGGINIAARLFGAANGTERIFNLSELKNLKDKITKAAFQSFEAEQVTSRPR